MSWPKNSGENTYVDKARSALPEKKAYGASWIWTGVQIQAMSRQELIKNVLEYT